MLTRVLFALVLVVAPIPAWAEDAKVLALGLADHEVTREELDKGTALAAPRFNTPAIAYTSIANLKKGDVVEIMLVNDDRPLLHSTETLTEDQAKYLLQAGGACRRLARGQLPRRANGYARRQTAHRAIQPAHPLRLVARPKGVLCASAPRRSRSRRPSRVSGRCRRGLPSGSACGTGRCRT